MGGVFISYRRDDSRGSAGRLYDNLSEHFGAGRVFRDLDAIQPGAVYRDVIATAIAGSDALIVVIGTNWTSARDASGQRRLENATDFVRVEIATALAQDKVVVPVLVEDAMMPTAADLPADLAALADRNALPVSDARWDYDVGRLISIIETLGPPIATQSRAVSAAAAPPRPVLSSERRRRAALPVLAVLVLGILGIGVLIGRTTGGGGGGAGPGGADAAGATRPAKSASVVEPSGSGDRPDGSSVITAPGPPGAIPISVGDSVGAGKPAGAGNIATPGAKQDFAFSGTAGQIVYLKAMPDAARQVRWTLLDPSGGPINDRSADSDIGRVKLKANGAHVIRVYGDESATGVYGFTVLAVPPDATFAISVGEGVGSGRPPGAGNITAAGAEHLFTFTGKAGQALYFKAMPDAAREVRWALEGPSGATIDDRSADSDIGRVKLTADGPHVIRVYGSEAATGVYGFSVTPVA